MDERSFMLEMKQSLRTHLMRFVHQFCERDCENSQNKSLFYGEKDRLVSKGLPPSTYPSPAQLDGHGLLYRIAHAFMTHPMEDAFFVASHLSSSLEAFLRGSSPKERRLLVNLGMVEYLVKLILDGVRLRDFDLLGGLVLMNPEACRVLYEYLGGTDEALTSLLLDVTLKNLVFSNVFLRSLILSCYHMDPAQQERLDTLRVFNVWMRDHELDILTGLLVDTVEDINHENFCSINSSIMIYTKARREHRLEGLVFRVLEVADSKFDSGEFTHRRGILHLLWFWKEYYVARAKDKRSLAFFADIPFEELMETVLLVEQLHEGLYDTPVLKYSNAQEDLKASFNLA